MVAQAQQPKRERVSKPLTLKPANTIDLSDTANIRAEEAVIGAVLHKPELYPALAETLQPGDFFNLFNGYIWHAFGELLEASTEIDLVTVADRLEARKVLDMNWLTALTAAVPDVNNIEHYARMVRDASTRLRIISAAAEMIDNTLGKTFPTVEALIDDCNRLLYSATDQRVQTDTSAQSIISTYYDRIEAAMSGKDIAGVPTGWSHFDALLHGFAPGEVTVLAGNEGMGKTTWVLSALRNALKQGLHVAHFTLEMTQEEIIRALTAMESGIPKDVLKTGKLSRAQWSKFVESAGVISKWPLHVIDEYPSLSPVQLRRRLRKMMVTESVQLVSIDGLWLMDATEPTDDRPRDVFHIMRDLNTLAKQFYLPILITHQYNGKAFDRADKKKRPMIWDLAESAAVRRNAQVIIGLYRDKFYGIETGQDLTEAHILKDRNGVATGKHGQFFYNAPYALYEEAAWSL
jgi:replicative DNA helicase